MFKQRALVSLFGVVILLTGIIFTAFLPMGSASAAQITNRSLTLVAAGANTNGSEPGATVDHLFSYRLPTAGNIESIQFQYCTLADGACVTPNGLVTTASTLGAQSGASFATLNNSTNGAPYIFSTSNVSITANEAVTTQLNGITNPSGSDCSGSFLDNCTFYVRITTYTSDTATTGLTDSGNVAASVNQQVVLSGQMPESLVFCVGATVSETSGVPDCSTVTNSSSSPYITFNQLFSPTSTASATSQMAASTNAGSGYAITVWGPTLTSGSNTLNAMSSSGASILGTSQFGMNLMNNTIPLVGGAITPTSDGVNYYGEPTPASGYDVANNYKFVSGNQIADSYDGTAPYATDAQIYTASYIANVPGKQAAGTYTTTLTYICTPTF